MKLCAYCKKELFQKEGEKRPWFLKRKYCNRTCYFTHKKILNEELRVEQDELEPVRICPSCGLILKRKSGEKRAEFMTRKYCDLKCSSHGRGRVNKEKTILDDHPRQRLDFDTPEILRRAHMAAPQVPVSILSDVVRAIEPMIAANARAKTLGLIAADIRNNRTKEK